MSININVGDLLIVVAILLLIVLLFAIYMAKDSRKKVVGITILIIVTIIIVLIASRLRQNKVMVIDQQPIAMESTIPTAEPLVIPPPVITTIIPAEITTPAAKTDIVASAVVTEDKGDVTATTTPVITTVTKDSESPVSYAGPRAVEDIIAPTAPPNEKRNHTYAPYHYEQPYYYDYTPYDYEPYYYPEYEPCYPPEDRRYDPPYEPYYPPELPPRPERPERESYAPDHEWYGYNDPEYNLAVDYIPDHYRNADSGGYGEYSSGVDNYTAGFRTSEPEHHSNASSVDGANDGIVGGF